MVHISTEPANHGRLGASRRSDRESNPDLIFRRDLFYPLNYQTIPTAKVMKVWRNPSKFTKNVLVSCGMCKKIGDSARYKHNF